MQVFWAGALAEMAVATHAVEQALHELARGLVRPIRRARRRTSRFGWHLLVRDVCYARSPGCPCGPSPRRGGLGRASGGRAGRDLADVLAHH